jgi:hypothetical protein
LAKNYWTNKSDRRIFLILYNIEAFHSISFLTSKKESEDQIYLQYSPPIIFRFLPSSLPEHDQEYSPAVPRDILIKVKEERRACMTKNFPESNVGVENKNVGKGTLKERMKYRADISAQVRKSKRSIKPTN